ncbi:dipeptidase PepE [Flavobacteriaceae bacterium S0825]|uniref:dipeptidase PepE n=1 Tax=Gaetbulibacter sp. S0825 TaxID=2720084 RepID=UPI0014317805|nr:dipeptidase PepE [Gaetbulibacter sp. S0825]MCK0110361.1 dipeptidase PepE [Flavobacteriaceae bacterium S0825]NIX65990.1 dipeptidase PepE [Gaetbulibacter sp. S0825]
MKKILIASTSTIHGSNFLDYLLSDLEEHFKDTTEVLFIPYARPGGISHEDYTKKAQGAFKKINKTLIGLHEFTNVKEALTNAKGIFVGGGNTFVLVNKLYKNDLITTLQKVVLNGTPYLGTSAGSNICGLTMNTTNDMPIVYPPSFKTLGFVPFNINPHYLDPDPSSTHMGETRETRIQEFHKFNTQPVIGLREGSFLKVLNEDIVLKGHLSARIFLHNEEPYEIETNTSLNFLK